MDVRTPHFLVLLQLGCSELRAKQEGQVATYQLGSLGT